MVHTDFQRKGIGTIGMETLLKHCQHENIRWVQLFCAKGSNHFIRSFGLRNVTQKCPWNDAV
ncbi:GNAT family N-acetyltransferase [Lysinibacillus fusiformis]|uniref:GNAT family N-acetyltransferase n=1 Tax=Lysinibacillus fusiformis TaxID=28031 RepID=UPI001F3D52D4|nr:MULTISPECIES: GNAT family N-acetyltransferase [Lysinibacillus]MED4670490.1 GNAT family N-acetyltransferase [Lysinibacillus fusiformis]